MRLGRGRKKQCSIGRLNHRKLFSILAVPKYDFMVCLALTKHIILCGLSKMRLAGGRESNIANGRQALRTRFRFHAIAKYDFNEVKKTMILGVTLH